VGAGTGGAASGFGGGGPSRESTANTVDRKRTSSLCYQRVLEEGGQAVVQGHLGEVEEMISDLIHAALCVGQPQSPRLHHPGNRELLSCTRETNSMQFHVTSYGFIIYYIGWGNTNQ
jgi:hypothetical protein